MGVCLWLQQLTLNGWDHAETDRSSAATLDAYPADPDNFPQESYADRDLERAAVAASSGAFSSMVEPSLKAASECGNMYAGRSPFSAIS